MESYIKLNASREKELHWKSLIESVAAMRMEGDTDITLVCGDKKFGAHKLILEASSPYFVKMFHSQMEEATSGRVEFKSMQPDTLEAVLNYIYSGDVNMICTEQRAIDILEAAHMMELSNLTQFCIHALSTLISNDNINTIWDIACLYEIQILKTVIGKFVMKNFKELKKGSVLLEIDDLKWKELLQFAVSKQVCLDDLLQGIVDWLRHDFAQREKFASELLACIEPKYLTYKCLKAMLQDKTVMRLSTEIANKLNEIGVAMVFLNDGGRMQGTIRFVVPDLSKVSTDLYSSPIMIQNLPWSILIQSTSCDGSDKKNIGFFVKCNHTCEETSWSCNAKLEFRLISGNKDEDPFIRNTDDLFCSKTNAWGYKDFICLGDNSYVERKYIKKDMAIFEVEITAEARPGFCD